MAIAMDMAACRPRNGFSGRFVGRVWLPGEPGGPSPVWVRDDGVFDLSGRFPTLSHLLAQGAAVDLEAAAGARIGDTDAILANSAIVNQDPNSPYFLAPSDLQAVKACGVTFVASMLERVIEEQAKGNPDLASEIRTAIADEIGENLRGIVPGSEAAMRAKDILVQRGLWSQYLEVGIGPDAEVFTKCQPLAAVGTGAAIGIHPVSSWNNPEPEVVLAINAAGEIVGAALGNDVNLRDVEGRSALLLGRAKDNRASAAIGPFIRLLGADFSLDDVRQTAVSLTVRGEDDFVLEGSSRLSEISRDITDLAAQTVNEHNHYPDGVMLYTGTMFAPIQDRDGPGLGFTHHDGDVVLIAAPSLGGLMNRVTRTDQLSPWRFGLAELMNNLTVRGLLAE